ncbi:MAG: reverse transcriptase-like protein [Candidatus Levybacteria bacterium]|nr:reverse transcriptase-like protein [Candidatus Levybacteria bacterium]
MIDQEYPQCSHDGSPLVIKQTKRSPEQLKKSFYYSAYYFCPRCKRIYHDEKFKVVSERPTLFNAPNSKKIFDIEIWTDGACSRNGAPNAKAAWAFVSGKHEEAGLVDGKQTNNRGEALAIYHALVWAASKGYKKIKINSDSQITLHGVAKDPKKVKENRDIFERIYHTVLKHNLEVEYVKVLGHSDNNDNNRADALAVKLSLE